MLPIHTVLHPTDFSEHSQAAFQLAWALARDYSARLVLLHVAPPPVVAYGEGVIPPDPEEYYGELREQLQRLEVPGASLRVERVFVEGAPAADILRVAQQMQADLIVLGTHGRTGLARLLMGSVAEWIVRHAACPVLAVKSPFPAGAGKAAAERAAEAADTR